ncbi:hemolysin family protein [Sphingobacterium daejeonense]|jgi:CBS domain containing-hemolysin-like protein|uniref:Hemolysin family protein n=1 Tax=Sphingobacterium daejeonense TaxID=371142 RepID=A0ABW3RH97_9SPHI|nr:MULTISPECIES: hemolysin family protein [Sphingobacterium]MCT1530275.1 hemolysin family protein [Sphingobacterium daejeonense]VTP92708.1 magnesium/cobalt efflux protein CorC [Sphingobacterium daejeonense]
MAIDIFWTIFLVLANGFFVAAEFAIVKVRASQIELQAKSGSKVAKIAKSITDHLDGYLAATQLGITLASLALGWVGEAVMTQIVHQIFGLFNVELTGKLATNLGHVLAFSIITFLHIVFGELAPKSIAIQKPVATTMKIALPLQFFYYIFRPIIWLLNGFANFLLRLIGIQVSAHEASHSSEELQYLLEKGKESGALNNAEHELIKNVFDFNERIVKNIMVPRTKIVAVDKDDTAEEFINTVTEEGYSRIPIYDDNIDQIIGVVHTKDILPLIVKGKPVILKNIMRKPYFIPETKKINDLMTEFQQKRIQIAFVLDEFGGTAGMVTLEDIVEELVGEIQDEYDEETPVVEQISESEFMVDAGASVHDANGYLPLELPESSDYDTVAGLVSHLFEKIPDVGDSTEELGYRFTIIKKTQQNIEFVKLDLIETPNDDDDE